MDIKNFSIGVGFFLAAYLVYRLIKNEKPLSQVTDWNGITPANYVSLWITVVILGVSGIAYILSSF